MKKVLLAGVVLSGILFISMNINSSVEKPEKYKKACDGGDATGCTFLGFMYSNGIGVEYDTLKAVKFYTKACDGGVAGGCTNLGIMYHEGQGVKQD